MSRCTIVKYFLLLNLILKVLCLIVNEKCPDIKPYENFKVPAVKKYYKIYYHMPTDELEAINPLYYPNSLSLDCFYYAIDFEFGSFQSISFDTREFTNLFTINFTSGVNNEYTIEYKEPINDTKCNRDIIYDIKLIADYNNSDILAFWTCMNLRNNQSVQGAMILVENFGSIDEQIKNNILHTVLNITNKNKSDFNQIKSGELENCPLNYKDWGSCPSSLNITSVFHYYLILLIIVLLGILIVGVFYTMKHKKNNKIASIETNQNK